MGKSTKVNWQALHDKAHQAGQAAAEAVVPEPMYVVQRANPFDDTSPITRRYPPVMDGVCGFAWVTVRPGTSSFAKWLVQNGHAHKAYYGGVEVWVRGFGQSYTRKQAYADAYAATVKAEHPDLKVHAGGRLD